MAKIEEEKIFVKISSPYETYFEGEALAVSAVNETGPLDILPNHANLLSILIPGNVLVHLEDRKVIVPLKRGIMKVSTNKVQIFADV